MQSVSRETMRRKQHMTETFESSVHEEGNHKFHMDKTLYKGIKENDVGKIIDISKEGGQLNENQFLNEEQELELIVIEMRRKYDEIKTDTRKIETGIEKSRKLAQNLRGEETKLRDHITNSRQNLQTQQKSNDVLGATVEARVYDYDIYKEMQARLKQDILVLKKRNFDKDYSLKKEGIKLKTLRQDEFMKTRLSSRCKDMLQSIEKTVISKQNERTTKINSFYDALNRKHDNLRKREQRQKQIEEVMMKAMSEKLQEEKEWINICFVNIFLKKFLKNKMERLIAKNEIVETAYHKIRSNTDITDSKELITRFLNRERDYGSLLETIAEKENVLETIKGEMEKLEQTNRELTVESDIINEQSIRQIKDCGPLQKELNGLENDLKNIKQKKDLMHKWAARFFCAFYSKTRDQVMQKYNHKKNVEIIKDALHEVGKYTNQITGDQNNPDSINQVFMSTKPTLKTFDDDMVCRNNRVKTTAHDDSVLEGEDREAIYDGASQADYLQYNRRATKKNDQSRRFRIKTQLK